MTVLKEKVNTDSKALVQDDETKHLLSRSLRYLKAGYPIHFNGPSGTGKTSLALALAKKRKRPVMLIHGNHELNNRDLIGDFTGYSSKKTVDNYVRSVYKKDESVTETWRDGRLLEAAKNGYTLVYDEFTRSHPTTNNIFLSILEEGVLPLYGSKLTEPYIRIHPKFSVIFTSNPLEYAGVYETQDALLDRLITIPLGYKAIEQEAAILVGKIGIEEEEAQAITTLVANLREKCLKESRSGPSLRSSLMIARLASEEDIPIDGNDEDFQVLCTDLLTYTVSECMEAEHSEEEARNLILESCVEHV
ncbi:gas vesicle protein GvpN [Virgibacillus phasianinus]|uniref:Gas vesicle protein GvpN n=1 Tax=Virgibacillus phasianinus TaxID=2017483 RepID=A0A220U2P2_9BACI|nr:gas vesicle protein GvpN [Virgibacillus phasianinus]ASK62111.1 gas vesicle protein GvpN [Virgibacillus phasianinus]